MRKRGFASILALAALAVAAVPVSAQLTANALPSGEVLPGVWTAAAPVFPVPSQWAANVSYAVTNPTPGVYTYWYQIQHTGGSVAPIQTLKSSTLNLSPTLVQDVAAVKQFGQFDLGPGQSWAAEAIYPGDSTLRWSHLATGGLNQLASGETIYLWLRSQHAPATLVNLTLQDGTVAQTQVLGPAPVPEPMSMALVGLGLSAVAGLRRRR